MLLPIYIYGSAVLRKESEDIAKDYPGLDKFLENLWETMYEADGVGLAAPQVGRNIRIFVVDASVNADKDPSLAGFKKPLSTRTSTNAPATPFRSTKDV